MISSMTGFARAEGVVDGLAWAWEVRSVNGRGLDLRLRLPPSFESLEAGIRAETARVLRRGNVTATLTAKREERTRLTLDPVLLDEMVTLVLAVAARLPNAAAPSPEAVLALPGVLRQANAEEAGVSAAQTAAVLAGFTRAVAGLAAARAEEGARLYTLLAGQLDQVADLHRAATADAAAQPGLLQARLQASLAPLLADRSLTPDRLTPERLAHEVALLATRADVQEELDRLGSHVTAARVLLGEGQAIGRRFDFLVQEFMREANTLCSKSASIPLTRSGLAMKALIEHMREQVQNVE